MSNKVTRRGFLRQAASGAVLGSVSNVPHARVLNGFEQLPVLRDVPTLDGSLVYDDATVGAAAMDFGRFITRRPHAVLRPGTVQDIVRIVQYANAQRMPVAMRGRAHSRYGLALVERGIVIDSRPLNKVGGVAGDVIELEAGCALSTLVRAALDVGYAVPVMTECTMLSVGGFLSVGGQSQGSQRFGAFVDQVRELEVVTGDGRLVTCSESHEKELFEMTLAGLGQCSIIVRAKLGLVRAPDQVTRRTVTYDALEPFLAEQERLLGVDGLDLMSGGIRRGADGAWEYRITLGVFGSSGNPADPITFISSNGPGRVSKPVQQRYASYFPGVSTSPAITPSPPSRAPAAPRRPVAAPSLAVWLPGSATRELVADYLSSSDDTAGITDIECTGLSTKRFRRPLFRVPAEERMFAFWTLRSVFADAGPSLEAQLAANAKFLQRALSRGAKRYPPYGGVASVTEWRAHYGESLYRRFAAAKLKYDPRGLLTPGPRVFA
jgi:FAD/FMN-containing dehydrogenase